MFLREEGETINDLLSSGDCTISRFLTGDLILACAAETHRALYTP